MHSVMHNTYMKHGRNMRMGRHQLCSEERIEVLSNTIERHHPSRNTPSLLYPDSCSDGNWRSHIRKKEVYASPRFLAKISFKDYWICGVKTINWENSSWKHLSLVMSMSSVLSAEKSSYSNTILCQSYMAWEDKLTWFNSSREYRALDRIDGEPIEFEWNIFQGFTTLQLRHKVQKLLLRLGETPENFIGRIIFMSMFNNISWGSKNNKKKCESNAQLVSLFAKRFGAGRSSFLGLGSEKKWYSISEAGPQGEWDKMALKMMVTLAESGHPVFRVTSPLSRGVLKSKGGGKLSIHWCTDQETFKTFFRTITSVNQPSFYGTVVTMCEDISILCGKTRCERTVEFLVRAKCDQDKRAFDWWCSCTERSSIAKIWRTNWKVITTSQIKQILFGCRIPDCSWSRTQIQWFDTLPKDEKSSDLKGWIRGNTKIGVGSHNRHLQDKYGVEIWIESVKKDNSLSWVRISYGSNKLFTNLNNNEQEMSEM